MIYLRAAAALRLCQSVLEQVGVPAEEARICAEVQVDGSLRGIDSHGIRAIPGYVAKVRRGLCPARANLTVVHETATTARLDAHFSLGQVTAVRMMRLAMDKARATGMGMVVAYNCDHFGPASYYPRMAAAEGLIGMTCSINTGSVVVPHGGRVGLHDTNPISWAIPAGEERPIVVDMATSVAASGKIGGYAARGLDIPVGWAIDRVEGKPVTTPEQVRAGYYHLPAAGHKGYGLGLVVDVLSAGLAGSWLAREFAEARPGERRTGSFCVQAIDPAAFLPLDQFKGRVDRLIRDARATPPAEGFDEVLVPGDPEHRTWLKRSAEGIPFEEQAWEGFLAQLRELEIDIPDWQ